MAIGRVSYLSREGAKPYQSPRIRDLSDRVINLDGQSFASQASHR